jgi:hypothetical protein
MNSLILAFVLSFSAPTSHHHAAHASAVIHHASAPQKVLVCSTSRELAAGRVGGRVQECEWSR